MKAVNDFDKSGASFARHILAKIEVLNLKISVTVYTSDTLVYL